MSRPNPIRLLAETPIKVVFKAIHYIYPYKLSAIFSKIWQSCYTAWLAPDFKHIGKGSVIYQKSSITGAKYISIGQNTCFFPESELSALDFFNGKQYTPAIEIGDNCCLGKYIHISCINKVFIGNNVLTGKWVTIVDNGHGGLSADTVDIPPFDRPLDSNGATVISDNVWIGDKVTILSGVTIGFGAIIGANSVVTHDVPPRSVVAGSPARVIKSL